MGRGGGGTARIKLLQCMHMLDDDVHIIPLHAKKQDTVVVYLFHVQIWQSEESGYWYATHPLLKDEDGDDIRRESRYEAWCSAQVYLRFLLRDNPEALERHGYKTRVIAIDRPEAAVVNRPANEVTGAYAPLDTASCNRFLNDIFAQYGDHSSHKNSVDDQKIEALLWAVRDAFCNDTPPFNTPPLDRVNARVIQTLTEYAMAHINGPPPNNFDAFRDRLLPAFIATIATAVADHVAVKNKDGDTKVGGFTIPQWFVNHVRREWKRSTQHRRELFSYHFDTVGTGASRNLS